MNTTAINHEEEAAKWSLAATENSKAATQVITTPEAAVGNTIVQALLAVHHDLSRLAEVLEQMQVSQPWQR